VCDSSCDSPPGPSPHDQRPKNQLACSPQRAPRSNRRPPTPYRCRSLSEVPSVWLKKPDCRPPTCAASSVMSRPYSASSQLPLGGVSDTRRSKRCLSAIVLSVSPGLLAGTEPAIQVMFSPALPEY